MSEFTGFTKWPWEIARELTASQGRDFERYIRFRIRETKQAEQMIPPIWLL